MKSLLVTLCLVAFMTWMTLKISETYFQPKPSAETASEEQTPAVVNQRIQDMQEEILRRPQELEKQLQTQEQSQ